MTMFLAVLFALASALALLFAVLWLRALAAYEDRSKAFERAAADCVRLEGENERLRRALKLAVPDLRVRGDFYREASADA